MTKFAYQTRWTFAWNRQHAPSHFFSRGVGCRGRRLKCG